MAAHLATNISEIQNRLAASHSDLDFRRALTPAFDLGRDSFPMASEVLKNREDTVVSWNSIKKQPFTIGSERDANHMGPRGDSYKGTPTWQTVTVSFSNSLKEFDNNVIDANEAILRQVEQGVNELVGRLELLTITNLIANKSQVNLGKDVGTFSAANNTFEIPIAAQNLFFQRLESMMAQNKHRGGITVLGDSLAVTSGQFLMNQGITNGTNYAFQFGGMGVTQADFFSLNTQYSQGFVLALPRYAYGVTTWIPIQNRRGDGEDGVGHYGTVIDPVTSTSFAIHSYTQRANTQGPLLNGQQQDQVYEIELSVDYCFMATPFSDPLETAIYAAAIV